ncbi:transposase [Pseudodesulfovibrio profundus]|uniref:Transposase n=2 Tax=Pseudodesulfovibrio profundus TaxID=57320 RepID=A0A2C8F978_9BACT|nr:transposase [Pseudodesulfovibrio profundus]MBC17776.1 DDE transposase [Desulfovibrio sp.]SOB59182.1 transposase [Pseudodesulfovibrio profundus]|tara:strand:- start:35 stop:964 length:930 start_codon:yes stop_codon:yes gene_type:complete
MTATTAMGMKMHVVPPMIIPEIPEGFAALTKDDGKAREYLLSQTWPTGDPFCPRCGHRKVYSLSGDRLRCASCKYTFQPFSGRWINNGALSPSEWLRLITLFVEECSVHQMKQELNLSYNTVYKALTAIRFAILAHAIDARQLISAATGLDSYLKGNRLTGGPREMRMDTIPVYGILRRDDLVFIDLVPGFQAETLFHFHMNFHLKLIRTGNLVYTDRYKDYDALIFCGNDSLPYEVIRRYDEPPHIDAVNDEFWDFAQTRIKRFRGISCQRFPLYLKELEFRFNNREKSIAEIITAYLCALVPVQESA